MRAARLETVERSSGGSNVDPTALTVARRVDTVLLPRRRCAGSPSSAPGVLVHLRLVVLAPAASLLGGCIPHLYSLEPTTVGCEWTAPTNRWDSATPPECLVGEGYEQGQVVPDIRLGDQFGDLVSVWQFSGDVILLDVSTIWCAPCQQLGAGTEEVWQEYRDYGFTYVTVLQADLEGNEVDPEDLDLWVNGFYESGVSEAPISAPVLADSAKTVGVVQNNQYPALIVIDRDLNVLERVSETTEEAVRAAVERALDL